MDGRRTRIWAPRAPSSRTRTGADPAPPGGHCHRPGGRCSRHRGSISSCRLARRGRIMRGAYWRGGDQLDAGWVPATALLVRRQAVDSAGLLDERFFLYGEDIEWCWRMRRAGWSIGVCSRGARSSPGGRQRFSHLCRRGGPAPYGRGRDRGGAKAPRRSLCALLRPCHRPCAQTRGASPRAVHGTANERERSCAHVAPSGGARDGVSGNGVTEDELVASVVISTFNRADALIETLETLAQQDLAHDRYEVIVVDDGSTDHTWSVLDSGIDAVRPENASGTRRTAASRPAGTRGSARLGGGTSSSSATTSSPRRTSSAATWRCSSACPATGWSAPSASAIPSPIHPSGAIWTSSSASSSEHERHTRSPRGCGRWPGRPRATSHCRAPTSSGSDCSTSASGPHARTRTSPQRARRIGIRFVYATEIDCVHNDQTADLARYCNFQERGARDTVALCAKTPELHGAAPIARVNGPISRADGVQLALKKLGKLGLAFRSLPSPVRGHQGR